MMKMTPLLTMMDDHDDIDENDDVYDIGYKTTTIMMTTMGILILTRNVDGTNAMTMNDDDDNKDNDDKGDRDKDTADDYNDEKLLQPKTTGCIKTRDKRTPSAPLCASSFGLGGVEGSELTQGQ
jgi:hypothetical protein